MMHSGPAKIVFSIVVLQLGFFSFHDAFAVRSSARDRKEVRQQERVAREHVRAEDRLSNIDSNTVIPAGTSLAALSGTQKVVACALLVTLLTPCVMAVNGGSFTYSPQDPYENETWQQKCHRVDLTDNFWRKWCKEMYAREKAAEKTEEEFFKGL